MAELLHLVALYCAGGPNKVVSERMHAILTVLIIIVL